LTPDDGALAMDAHGQMIARHRFGPQSEPLGNASGAP
jgi:hypothetical protein